MFCRSYRDFAHGFSNIEFAFIRIRYLYLLAYITQISTLQFVFSNVHNNPMENQTQ